MCTSALSDIRRFWAHPLQVEDGASELWVALQLAGGTGPQASLPLLPSVLTLWVPPQVEAGVRRLPCCCWLLGGACGLGCRGSGAKFQALPMLILQFYPFHVFHCTHLRCADVWNSLVSWCVGQRPSC